MNNSILCALFQFRFSVFGDINKSMETSAWRQKKKQHEWNTKSKTEGIARKKCETYDELWIFSSKKRAAREMQMSSWVYCVIRPQISEQNKHVSFFYFYFAFFSVGNFTLIWLATDDWWTEVCASDTRKTSHFNSVLHVRSFSKWATTRHCWKVFIHVSYKGATTANNWIPFGIMWCGKWTLFGHNFRRGLTMEMCASLLTRLSSTFWESIWSKPIGADEGDHIHFSLPKVFFRTFSDNGRLENRRFLFRKPQNRLKKLAPCSSSWIIPWEQPDSCYNQFL